MPYQPLTREQYDNAVKSGFKPDEIIQMEKKRKSESGPGTGSLFSGQPTFKADTSGGAGTILPNIARTIGNIPSDVAGTVGTAARDIAQIPGQVQALQKEQGPNAAHFFGQGLSDTLGKIGSNVMGGIEGAIKDPRQAAQNIAAGAIEHPVSAALTFEGAGAGVGRDAIQGTAGAAANLAKPVAAATVPGVADAFSVFKGAAKSAGTSVKEGIGVGQAAQVGKDIAAPVKAMTLPSRLANLDKTIVTDFTKAMQRSIGSTAKTLMAKSRATGQVARGIRQIVENKGILKLTDEFGSAVEGLPRTLEQLGQSIQQTKSNLFKAYDDLAKQASTKATFDMGQQIKDMKAALTSPDFARGKTNAELKMMQNKLPELMRLHDAPFSAVQDYLKTLNSTMGSYFKTGVASAEQKVNASIVDQLTKMMDEQIGRHAGEGFKAIRKKFSDVKSLEEMTARAIARRTPEGLGNLVNVFSGEEIAMGVITANPYQIIRGTTLSTVKKLMKAFSDPDRAIAKMFDNVDGIYEELKAAKAPAAPSSLPVPSASNLPVKP